MPNHTKNLPEGWKETPLGKMVDKRNQKHDCSKDNNDLPCIELEHIEEATGRVLGYVSSLNQKSIKNKFFNGDVVFGKLRPYLRKYFLANMNGVASSETWVLKFKEGKGDNNFLFYLVQSDKFVESCNRTTGTKMPRADWSLISDELFPFPPIAEQRKISILLSTWDHAISTLTQLISAKQELKKGLMQQLLTGKKRLPGFEGEWESLRLGEVLDYEQPGDYIVKSEEYNDSIGVPVLTANKSFLLGYTQESFGVFTKVPVIIFDDFTTASKYVEMPFKVKSSAIKILKPLGDSINIRFVYDRLQLINYEASDHKRYWISEFQELEVEFPNLEEQNAIAKVSEDFERDIKIYSTILECFKLQKSGIMQQLLTGKKRVKVNPD